MKQELRKQALLQRKSLDLSQISLQICKQIQNLVQYQKATDVAIFYPKNTEINLLPLCNDKNKNFYLPKVHGNSMQFFKFENENELQKGAFDILEPTSNIVAQNLDVIITPALMADKSGYRLGWGGGFYDKYLFNFKGLKICPIPDCQIIDSLKSEEYDIPCDFVVSEKKIINLYTI